MKANVSKRLRACWQSVLVLSMAGLIASCGGAGSSGGSAVVSTENINGITVPIEPNPNSNNTTLKGTDTNKNGVRDDVERKIALESKNSLEFSQAMNEAILYELTLEKPTSKDESLALTKKLMCANKANNTTMSGRKLLDEYLTTPERRKAHYEHAKSAGAFLSFNLDNCDNTTLTSKTIQKEIMKENYLSSIKEDNVVIFLNGINNSLDDAKESMESLEDTLANYKLSKNYDIRYIYNPRGTWLPKYTIVPEDDLDEMVMQATVSNEAKKLANKDLKDNTSINFKERYYYHLGYFYSDEKLFYKTTLANIGAQNLTVNGSNFVRALSESDGENTIKITTVVKKILAELVASKKNVIVVAHSQGNFIIEAAIGMLIYEGKQTVVDRIKVVGIAPVSATTYNDRYILGYYDTAVNTALGLNLENNDVKDYVGLEPNTLICDAFDNTIPASLNPLSENFNHSFIKAYNTFNRKICGQEILLRKAIFNLVELSISEFYPTANININRNTVDLYLNTTFASNIVTFKPIVNTSPNGAVTEFEWNFGDGTVQMQTGDVIKHTYVATGEYTVTLKIKDIKGVINTTTTKLNISFIEQPKPTIITISTPPTIILGKQIPFTITGENLPLTAVLSIQDGECDNANATNRSATGFTVMCTVSGVAGEKKLTIKTDVSANNGTVIDESKFVTISTVPVVTPPPPVAPTPFNKAPIITGFYINDSSAETIAGGFNISDEDGNQVKNMRVHISTYEGGSDCTIDVGGVYGASIQNTGPKSFSSETCPKVLNQSNIFHAKVEAYDSNGLQANIVKTTFRYAPIISVPLPSISSVRIYNFNSASQTFSTGLKEYNNPVILLSGSNLSQTTVVNVNGYSCNIQAPLTASNFGKIGFNTSGVYNYLDKYTYPSNSGYSSGFAFVCLGNSIAKGTNVAIEIKNKAGEEAIWSTSAIVQ